VLVCITRASKYFFSALKKIERTYFPSLLQNAMCCFSVCFFKARLLRMRWGAVGFSATAFIERRRPSVQERCVRKESVWRKVWSHVSVAKDGSAFSLPFKKGKKEENPSRG
jgi:hypothetical protein